MRDYSDRKLKVEYQKIFFSEIDIMSPIFDDEDPSVVNKMIIIFLKKKTNSKLYHSHDSDEGHEKDKEYGSEEEHGKDEDSEELAPNSLRIYFGEEPICDLCPYNNHRFTTNGLAITNIILALFMIIFTLVFFIKANRMLCGSKSLIYAKSKQEKSSVEENKKSDEELKFEEKDQMNPYINSQNLDINYDFQNKESEDFDTK